MSGSNEKGFFHQLTGVPFKTAVQGPTATMDYQQRKRQDEQSLAQANQEFGRQLKVKGDLEQQSDETMAKLEQLVALRDSTQNSVAAQNMERVRLEKQMEERRKSYTQRDVQNTTESVISVIVKPIPVVRTVWQTYQYGKIAKDVHQEAQDRQQLSQVEQQHQTTMVELGQRQRAVDTQVASVDAIATKQLANYQALKNLQNTATELTKKVEKN